MRGCMGIQRVVGVSGETFLCSLARLGGGEVAVDDE